MPYITTDDGVRLYYEEAGAGIPIVFVITVMRAIGGFGKIYAKYRVRQIVTLWAYETGR